MPERMRRQETAAWCALQKSQLDQIGFDDVLDGVTRLR